MVLKNKISNLIARRDFMKLAGSTLVTPPLMTFLSDKSLGATPVKMDAFIGFRTHHSTIAAHWFAPSQVNPVYTHPTEGWRVYQTPSRPSDIAPALLQLNSIGRDNLTVAYGLDFSLPGSAPHHSPRMFNGMQLDANSSGVNYNAKSFDQLIGSYIYDSEPFRRTLSIANSAGAVNSVQLNASGTFNLNSSVLTLDGIWNSLFSNAVAFNGSSEARKFSEEAMMNFQISQLTELANLDVLSSIDKANISNLTDLLNDSKRRLENLRDMTNSCSIPAYTEGHLYHNTNLYLAAADLITAAILCGRCKVFTISLPCDTYSASPIPAPYNSLGTLYTGDPNTADVHHAFHAATDLNRADLKNKILDCEHWVNVIIARLASNLASFTNVVTGQKYLDTSLIMSVAENGAQPNARDAGDHPHSVEDYVALLVGGKSFLRTGYLYDYKNSLDPITVPMRGRRLRPAYFYNNILHTIMHTCGVPASAWEKSSGSGYGSWHCYRDPQGRPSQLDYTSIVNNVRTRNLPSILLSDARPW
jgi:hypothetical protein